jgi:lambda family phage portal protein
LLGDFLDHAIGIFAPAKAEARVRARARLDAATRAYSGAAKGRHTDGWKARSTSADAEIAAAGRTLRDRARDLDRNNPHAAKAAAILTNDIVGEGIVPRPNTGDDRKNAKVLRAFEKWADQCDADGQLDFYGLQTLAVRGTVVGGEMLIRRRRRLSRDGLAVPLQIQLLEPDFLDDSKHGPLAGGGTAVQGVEFDAIGRRAGYWLFSSHPGNDFAAAYSSSRVPASEIAHLYEKQRTQARGTPWLAPVIRRIRDIDDYDFAEGIRKKIEASLVAFVTGEDDDLNLTEDREKGRARVEDAHGNILEKFAPGVIAYLRGGKDVKFNSPAAVGGYEDYKRVGAREIAAGGRVPYALLTGDGSQENFSAQRYLLVDHRRRCGVWQWQMVIPMALDPIWSWFCEAAYAVGEIDEPHVPVKWSPQRWEAIEPYKDAMADLLTQRMGNRSWREVTAARGFDPSEVLHEIAEHNADLDRLKIVLDSDPRNTTMSGVLQKIVADAAASEAAGPSGQN